MQYVHQRVGEGTAQVAQLGGEAGEADARVGREGQSVVVPAALQRALQERVEGVGERDHLGGVDPSTASASRRSGSSSPSTRAWDTSRRAAAAEQGEVAGADPPARAGQQPDEGRRWRRGPGGPRRRRPGRRSPAGAAARTGRRPRRARHGRPGRPGSPRSPWPCGTGRRSRRGPCRCSPDARPSRRASRSPRRGCAAGRSGRCRHARRRGPGGGPPRPRAGRAAVRRGRWRGRAAGRRCGGSR